MLYLLLDPDDVDYLNKISSIMDTLSDNNYDNMDLDEIKLWLDDKITQMMSLKLVD